MPTYNTTTRLAIRKPQANQKVNDFTPIVDALADDADAKTVGWLTGLLAARGSAGTAGRLHRATDAKAWSLDNGSSWDQVVALTVTPAASNVTAAPGQLVKATAGITVTLPSPALGAFVGVEAPSASGASPVTVSGTNIYGPGLAAASSFLLGTPSAYVLLAGDGVNWLTIAGQQDTGWVAISGTGSWTSLVAMSARLVGDRVYLRGANRNDTGSASSAPLVALPAAFRPSVVRYAACSYLTNGAGSLSVATDGTVTASPQVQPGWSVGYDNVSWVP